MHVLLGVLAAITYGADVPETGPNHVYALPDPPSASTYRLRLNDAAARQWALEQISGIAVFDNTGTALACDLLQMSRYADTHKKYPLEGTWHDLDAAQANARSRAPYNFNFAWQFALPAFAEHESPFSLHFDWKSNVNDPGYVMFREVPQPKGLSRPGGETHLMNGQSNAAQGHANVGLYTSVPGVWPASGELLFSRSQDELTIESPYLETLVRRPWTLLPAPGPGWILFTTNGKAPYRLQIGEVLYGCGQSVTVVEPDAATNPEWPPEISMGEEIAGADHMGETQASFRKQWADRQAGAAHAGWLAWSISVAIGFLLAIGIALVPPRR